MIHGYVLSSIICNEYDKRIRKDNTNPNTHFGDPIPKAMLVTFTVGNSSHSAGKDMFVDMLLFGQGYVTVLKRIRYKYENTKDFTQTTGWEELSCHDSCWREDGVASLINEYAYPQSKEDIEFIGDSTGWYKVFNLNEKEWIYLSYIKQKY